MNLVVSVPFTFPWETQARQYPKDGPKGISYFEGHVEQGTVDCLLLRDKNGKVRGILNHYPIDMPPHEKAGNISMWVDPRFQRKGIATKLLAEAEKRWRIDWERQSYTEAGAKLVINYLKSKPTSPFERAAYTKNNMTAELLAEAHNIPIAEARKAFAEFKKEMADSETWVNDKYTVLRRDLKNGIVYLSIKRNDKEPIHDWRDMQAIKNELVGPECEAVELYPAESRVVDTANQYHLWVYTDTSFRIPLGFHAGRLVSDREVAGSRQRPRVV